jgi:hypothetical protein
LWTIIQDAVTKITAAVSVLLLPKNFAKSRYNINKRTRDLVEKIGISEIFADIFALQHTGNSTKHLYSKPTS